MPDKEKEVVVVENQTQGDDEFFKDLIGDDNGVNEKPENSLSEEQRLKNKNAEEARKRREAEAKAAKVEVKTPVVEPAKVEQPSETKPAPANIPATAEPVKEEKTSEVQQDQKAQQVNKLGEQLVQFKQKYPSVDLAQLDGDKTFKRFIDGKLLGKKEFTALYEEYISFKSELTGQNANQVTQNYQKKAQSGTGSSVTTAPGNSDVYSEQELVQISQKLPFMSPKKAAEIEAKLKRSIAYYEKK
jgi:hypothetical protein